MTPPVTADTTPTKAWLLGYETGCAEGARSGTTAERRLALCVLIADKWTYDEDGQRELVEQAARVLALVEAACAPK